MPECIKLDDSSYPKNALYFSEIEFKVDLTVVRLLGGTQNVCRYTCGAVIDDLCEIIEHYQLREIEGREYLFIEWKSGDYIYGGRQPGYYVFMQ